jgi:hypothetical protein
MLLGPRRLLSAALLAMAGMLVLPSVARAAGDPPAWAAGLGPLRVISPTGRPRDLVLYRPDGSIDPKAVGVFAEAAAAPEQPVVMLPKRLVQLVVKAAHHFGAARVEIVSGWRSGGGPHGRAEAVDFRLSGVDYKKLAAYLRGLPRVGVGMYTHRRTRYVHLDVRERSYHWLDASPPRRHWKEMRLRDPKQAKRDASYTPEMDLPSDAAGKSAKSRKR